MPCINKLTTSAIADIMIQGHWKTLTQNERQQLCNRLLSINESWARHYINDSNFDLAHNIGEKGLDLAKIEKEALQESYKLDNLFQEFIQFFKRATFLKRDLKIADIGCGNSASPVYLNNQSNAYVYAVEPAKAFHDASELTFQDIAFDGIQVVRNSMYDLKDIPDESCYGVVMKDSLHRAPWFRGDSSAGLEKALKEVNRILKSGGVGFISMMSRKQAECPIYHNGDSGMKQRLTLDELDDVLDKFDMSILKQNTSEVTIDGVGDALWLDVVFERH